VIRTRLLAAALAFGLGFGVAARGEDAPEPEPKELDQAKVDAAIEKGVAWLKKQQKPDGRWDDGYAVEFPLGPTALAALALAKCAGPNDPAAARAFAALAPKDLKRTYDVGLVLMAIEARYAPSDAQLAKADASYSQLVRKAFGHALPADRALVGGSVDFLVKTQKKELWGYPSLEGGGGRGGGGGGGGEDLSNAQYAMLGLGAGHRLGLDAPPAGLEKALDALLKGQEQDGSEVNPSFVVPAADHTAKEIEALATELHKPKVRDEGGLTEIRKFWETAAREKMKARGFGYRFSEPEEGGGGNGGGQGQGGNGGGQGGGGRGGRGGWGRGGRMREPYLSMTCAGLACLITCKWCLEGRPNYPAKKVDAAIRDAAAYIAKNFEVGSSGGIGGGRQGGMADKHDYYVLYGVERAGAMTGCPYFGKHDWYVEGGEWILKNQNDDGSWGRAGPVERPIGQPETSVPDTCFALLFLKKGSVPLVPPIPKRIASGMH
jgi:hypothetical protein